MQDKSAEICLFKQKTAYEERMSDWSSDVCSSDLDNVGASLRGGSAADAAIPQRGAAPHLREQRDRTFVLGRPATTGYRRTLELSGRVLLLVDPVAQIGRATCRVRVCLYV